MFGSRGNVRIGTIELRDVVESTVEMLAEHALKKGLELNCWMDQDVPNLLRGDPGRLRQVVATAFEDIAKSTGGATYPSGHSTTAFEVALILGTMLPSKRGRRCG